MATANNPFDLSKPGTTGASFLTGATNMISAPVATGFNAATAGATGYDNAATQAFGYDATKASGTNWNVDNNQTVQGQLQGIIAANSPLMQQARTGALQQMNKRGLMNSSMAIGAGQDAVIRQAMPIAQQDATLFGNRAKYNADVANQMAQFNVGAENQALQFGAAASNQAGLANQAAANQAAQFSSAAANQAALANASAQNQAAQFSAAAANEASQQYSQALNATTNKMLDQSMQYALANADSQTKIELQNIDAATRKDLAATEAAYKNQMQASASANEIFQQVSKNISDLMANPDLETAAKQAAVDAQKSYLQSALGILSATSGIPGLKNLLSF
jgi:hypothetical protein